MSERRIVLIWVIVCSVLGIAFSYFFNTEGINIVASIWILIGCVVGFTIPNLDNLPTEPIAGWFMFGISLGTTAALMNYESWLSPLLR